MITAIIGTGGLGSAVARQLGSGGETLRLSSTDKESARTLAAQIGRGAVVAVDNRDALQGADAVSRAAVHRAEGRHRRDRRPAVRQARGRSEQPRRPRRTRQGCTSPAGGASLWRGSGRVVAGGDAPCHGVRNHVGRSPRVLEQPVTGARSSST